jgi:hypothetical protein
VDRSEVHYFTRLHTDSALVPVEVAGFELRNSLSSIDVMTRLPSVQFRDQCSIAPTK